MRQTLFRIRVDELWSFGSIEVDGRPVTAVGVGLLLVLWSAYGAYLLFRHRRNAPSGKETGGSDIGPESLVGSALAWLAVAGLLLSLPTWAPRLLPNGVPVFGYGVMVFLGFLFGGWVALGQAKRAGLPPEVIWDLVTWVFVAGIGGARLFYLVQKRQAVFAGVSGPRDFVMRAVNLADGGLVLLGGVLAVVGAVILFCRRRGISPLLMGDVLVAPFFIGLGFGRIGCLMNGCCFGDRCSLPWSIRFPPGSAAWGALVDRGFLGVTAETTYGLHPTQIYASATAFLLAGVAAAYFRRRPYDGAVLVVGMLLYATKRSIVEFLRGDELGQFGTMFTISQWISAGIFAAGLALWAWLATTRRPKVDGVAWTRPRPSAGAG